jgi:hypothetical protein
MLSREVLYPNIRHFRSVFWALLSIGLLGEALLVASPANAGTVSTRVSLEDLVNGGDVLLSYGGGLRFSDFAVEISGGDADISDYELKGNFKGFTVYGGGIGKQTETIDIRLTYNVETLRLDHRLIAVGLSWYKWNLYGGNSASIEVFGSEGQVIASGTRLEDRNIFHREYLYFSELVASARVTEVITIDPSSKGKHWKLNRRFKIKKGFAPVPEPNTALMVGFGIVGIAGYARKRRREVAHRTSPRSTVVRDTSKSRPRHSLRPRFAVCTQKRLPMSFN